MTSVSTMAQHPVAGHSGRRANEHGHSDALDQRWVVRLLRLGFALAALISQIAYFADTYTADHGRFDLRFVHISSPYAVFTLAASILAIAISFTPLFERFWKAVTLDLCIWLMAGWTYITVLNHQQAQLFVVILVLLMATCALVPWGTGWQATLTAGCIALAGINTLLVRPTSPFIVNLWLELLTASAITLAGTRLWTKWRTAVSQTHGRLRAEIAEREAAQKMLQESEAKLRKIFDSCPDIICINSVVDGRYIDVNPQFSVTGYTAHDAVYGSWEPLRLWADPGQFRKLLNELSAGEVVRNMEADLRLRDGTTRPCLVSGALVELGGEPCAVTFTSDITRLKQTERQLITAREDALAASRAKSEFLSSMSHEIRTPMNAILGLSDLLAETTLTQEQQRYVEIMTSNGNALLDLISGILDLAKVESGKLHLEETEFDLDELAESVAETLGVRAHGKGLELVTHVMADVPLRLVGDPLRLRQILVNLIANAIKFTERGEVALKVEKHAPAEVSGDGAGGEQIRFSVCDTGIGIPGNMREAIFRSFTQADSSVTRRYGGSGLGLAIVRRLVDLMGGSIGVESEVGKGSTFSFTVCFKAAPGSGASLSALPGLGNTRVLVVDDNAASRSSLREILSSRGAEVAQACDEREALAEIERARGASRSYDAVLLDHGLGDIDGLQVAERLQNQCGGAQAIILMMTPENLNAKLSRLRDMGLRDYLVKPAKRSDLVRAVAAVTGRTIEQPSFSAQQPARVNAVQRRSLRILLAEDSPDNRTLIQAYLKKLPYELDEAENGEVAAEKFMRHKYDLVLMDMQMPVMDGYTATRRIRRWEREKDRLATPILALTASALGEDVRHTLEAGCTAHLSKPVKKSRLLEVIQDLATKGAGDGTDGVVGPLIDETDGPRAPYVSPSHGIAA